MTDETPWYEKPFRVKVYDVGDEWEAELVPPTEITSGVLMPVPPTRIVRETEEEVRSAAASHISGWRASWRLLAARIAARNEAQTEEWA
jgi:hypothetical protein